MSDKACSTNRSRFCHLLPCCERALTPFPQSAKIAGVMKKLLLLCTYLAMPLTSWADTIGFEIGDFTLSPIFSDVRSFKFTIDLAVELEGTGVVVNALHPATYMDTAMVRRAGLTPRATVGEGADAVMQLVTEDIGSGGYFNGLRLSRANAQAYDEEARAKLWRLSEELTEAP